MGGDQVFDDGVARIACTGDPPLLALTGEIDEAVSPGVPDALEQAAAGHPEIHISMAGLTYCDLAGLRAIVGLTRTSEDSAERRQVVLYDVPPQVRAVLRIVGWDAVPGLALGGRSQPARPVTAGKTGGPGAQNHEETAGQPARTQR